MFKMCLRNIWMLHSHFTRPYKTWPISWFKSQDFRSSCKVNSQQTYNIKKSKVVEKSQKESFCIKAANFPDSKSKEFRPSCKIKSQQTYDIKKCWKKSSLKHGYYYYIPLLFQSHIVHIKKCQLGYEISTTVG